LRSRSGGSRRLGSLSGMVEARTDTSSGGSRAGSVGRDFGTAQGAEVGALYSIEARLRAARDALAFAVDKLARVQSAPGKPGTAVKGGGGVSVRGRQICRRNSSAEARPMECRRGRGAMARLSRWYKLSSDAASFATDRASRRRAPRLGTKQYRHRTAESGPDLRLPPRQFAQLRRRPAGRRADRHDHAGLAASGTWSSPTAMARFSAITGVGARVRSWLWRVGICGQSVDCTDSA
jgi:hypothetical protein